MYRIPERVTEDESSSFDSLLDTMTNVVGILVILLAVTQIGVRDAMRRIQSRLPEVSLQQFTILQDAHRQTREELSKLEDRLKTLQSADTESANKLRAEVESLRKTLSKKDTSLAERKRLEQQIKELEKKIREEEKKLNLLRVEAEKIKALLDKTPSRAAPPAKVINIPDPRPAPEGSTPIFAMCRYNRVAVMDADALRERLYDRIDLARGQVGAPARKKPKKSKKDLIPCDAGKLARYFKDNDLGAPNFDLEFRYNPERNYKQIYAEMNPRGGDPISRIHFPNSGFLRMLMQIRGRKHYVRFLVWPDSFEAYLAARELCDRYQVPAGWNLYTSPKWVTGMHWAIKIHGEKPPPPAPKPRAPKAPPNVLD